MGNLVVFPLGGERGEHALLGGVGMFCARSVAFQRQLSVSWGGLPLPMVQTTCQAEPCLPRTPPIC
jgi:hypothetical protein